MAGLSAQENDPEARMHPTQSILTVEVNAAASSWQRQVTCH